MHRIEEIRPILRVLDAFYDAVKEAGPNGAPAGPMYAAVMTRMQLDQFEALMNVLIKAGRVRKSGHVYYATGLDLLPEGVTVVGLENPAELHRTLKRELGE